MPDPDAAEARRKPLDPEAGSRKQPPHLIVGSSALRWRAPWAPMPMGWAKSACAIASTTSLLLYD